MVVYWWVCFFNPLNRWWPLTWLTDRMQRNKCYASLRFSLRACSFTFTLLEHCSEASTPERWLRPCGKEPRATTQVNKVSLDLPALPNPQPNAATDDIRRETGQLASQSWRTTSCFKTLSLGTVCYVAVELRETVCALILSQVSLFQHVCEIDSYCWIVLYCVTML